MDRNNGAASPPRAALPLFGTAGTEDTEGTAGAMDSADLWGPVGSVAPAGAATASRPPITTATATTPPVRCAVLMLSPLVRVPRPAGRGAGSSRCAAGPEAPS
nr:hypothetical protein GCM10020241_38440 [Streptoalloteichus tenebrarius]